MEVHAHTHSHGKKSWKQYFWEFLMLFLAVFCGFLAENFREHQVEHHRERQYMQSMLEDLEADTSMFIANIQSRQSRISMMDSLVSLLSSGATDKGSELYFLGRSISQPANIFSNDGTIQQLKSSGNLRLIRKDNVAKGILKYDQQIRQYFFEMGDEVEMRTAYRNIAVKIFDTRIFYQMENTEEIMKPDGNPKLSNTSPTLVNEYIGQVQYLKKIHQLQLSRSRFMLNEGKKLVDLIKKEYSLK